MEAYGKEKFSPITAAQLRQLLGAKGLLYIPIGSRIVEQVRGNVAVTSIPELFTTTNEEGKRLNDEWAAELMVMTGIFASYCWGQIGDALSRAGPSPEVTWMEGKNIQANLIGHHAKIIKTMESRLYAAVSTWADGLKASLPRMDDHVAGQWRKYVGMLLHRTGIIESAHRVNGQRAITQSELIATHLKTGFGTAIDTLTSLVGLIVLVMGDNGVQMSADTFNGSLKKNLGFIRLLSQLAVQFIDLLSPNNRIQFLDLVCFTIEKDGLPSFGLDPIRFPIWLDQQTIATGRHHSFTTCPANFSGTLNGFLDVATEALKRGTDEFFARTRPAGSGL